jgi:hypothetical protein
MAPVPKSSRCRGEGDGWVNWSGLATLAAEFKGRIVTAVDRLLTLQLTESVTRPALPGLEAGRSPAGAERDGITWLTASPH